jgi:hypothetical protein
MPSAFPFIRIAAKPPARYRGGGSYSPKQFNAQAVSMTWAWGCEPASATITYIGAVPTEEGAAVTLKIAGHTFYGICKRDQTKSGSDGTVRELQFVDNRDYLDWDEVYCAFNKPYDKIVNGKRVRRYKHMLPANFNAYKWTYTTAPLTAAMILDYIVGPSKWDTVEDPWTVLYHGDQLAYAVLDIDAMQGKKLKSILQEISDAQGLMFTLMGGPFNLVWARKGEGSTVSTPAGANMITSGSALSGYPTRVRVLGDRNLYQVSDIPMVADWSPSWAQFFDVTLFTDEIYRIGKTRVPMTIGGDTIPAGTAFSTISSEIDPERVIGHQLALAESLEITVGEYAALKGDVGFNDFRKFAGRSRMEMPAALYIQNILFRAFRFESGFVVRNFYGKDTPLGSLGIAGKMLAKVTHDPTTGEMEFDTTEAPDGNGYAIIQGYQVGKDMFRTLRPDRFDLSRWTDSQSVWEHIEFQVDDAGEEDGWYIIFDEPVVRSDDLVQMVNGYAVFKASPTFTTPAVRLCLTFEGEKFSYVKGTGTRDDVENVSGLGGEFISKHGAAPVEIPYENGQTATQKADVIATSLLSRQLSFDSGGFETYPIPDPSTGQFPTGTQLTGMIDRVTLSATTSGCKQTVDLTSERPRNTYIPERDLERAVKYKQLLPGQAALRQEANLARLTAAALRTSPGALRTVREAFGNIIGSSEPTHPARIAQPTI